MGEVTKMRLSPRKYNVVNLRYTYGQNNERLEVKEPRICSKKSLVPVFKESMNCITQMFTFTNCGEERGIFSFPIIGILGGVLFYQNTLPELFFVSIQMNLLFLVVLTLIIYLYVKLKLKTKFLNTLGLGDLFLFLAISVSFSTLSFIVLFLSALIFSLVLHLILNKSQKTVTVPLAGYMSLFFLISYLFYCVVFVDNFYSL